MNQYEECLFYYVMEHEWPDLLKQEAYCLLAEGRDEALNALIATFTPKQRRLYMTYEPRYNAACSAAAYATNMPPACLLNAAGRQPKWDTRRTDYEEAGGPAEIQWLFGLKSDSDRLDKSGGPARRGLALFLPTFGRTARRPLSSPLPAGHLNERKWARRRQASAEGRCRPSQRHRAPGCLTPGPPRTAPRCYCR